jgi:hypothetical protein
VTDAIIKQIGPVTSLRLYRFFMLAAPVFFLVAAYFASILTQRSASMGLLVFSIILLVLWLEAVFRRRRGRTSSDASLHLVEQTYLQDLLPAFLCSTGRVFPAAPYKFSICRFKDCPRNAPTREFSRKVKRYFY